MCVYIMCLIIVSKVGGPEGVYCLCLSDVVKKEKVAGAALSSKCTNRQSNCQNVWPAILRTVAVSKSMCSSSGTEARLAKNSKSR